MLLLVSLSAPRPSSVCAFLALQVDGKGWKRMRERVGGGGEGWDEEEKGGMRRKRVGGI